jgi:hypothetical protein
VLVAQKAAERGNVASAKTETIAAEWPAVCDRLEKTDEIARRALRETQGAALKTGETAARQTELEQAVAANFSITLTTKGT